jgi:hypothetical protein
MLPKEPKPALYSWSEVWTGVLTKPYTTTFTEILRDPQANLRRGYLWLYLTAVISGFISLYTLFTNPLTQEALLANTPEISGAMLSQALLTMLLCAAPLAGLLVILSFSIFVAAVQWLAMQMTPPPQRANRFEALLYSFSAIVSPLNILSLLVFVLATLSGVPLLIDVGTVLSLLLTVYQVVLMWLAVRAVYGLAPMLNSIALGVPLAVSFLLILLLIS